MLESLGIEPGADRGDAAIHHVGGGDHVGAGAGLVQRLLDEHRDGLVVQDFLAAHEAVMAVARIGIERHVGDEPQLRHGCLDGPAGTADEVLVVQGLGAFGVAQVGIGIGEDGDRRDAQRRSFLRGADRLIDRIAHDPRHRGNRLGALLAIDHENRPDQVIGRQDVFADEPARPVGFAIAAGPMRQAQLFGCGGFGARRKRRDPGFGFGRGHAEILEDLWFWNESSSRAAMRTRRAAAREPRHAAEGQLRRAPARAIWARP